MFFSGWTCGGGLAATIIVSTVEHAYIDQFQRR